MSGRRPEVTGRRPANFRRAATGQRLPPFRRPSSGPSVGPRCHGGGGQGGGSGLRPRREWRWRRRRLPRAAVAGRGGGDGPRPAGSRQGDLPPPAERYGPALGLLMQGRGFRAAERRSLAVPRCLSPRFGATYSAVLYIPRDSPTESESQSHRG